MARKLKFDLNVETNALLCPNPNEFYSKAYITEDIVDNYRTLPGIKYKTKIANQLFDANLLKDSSCTWSVGTDPLNAVDVDVCPVSAMAQICRFDIEQSFISQWMAKGSGAAFDVNQFMGYYFDEMSKHIAADIETIRWQGVNSGTSSTVKDLCDGYETLLSASASVVDVAATASITTSNVITEMDRVYNALVPALQSRIPELRLFVSSDIAAAYRQAAFAFTNANIPSINGALQLTYLGIKIVVAQGMSTKKMVLTHKDNLIYAFDGENDAKVLKAINLEETVAEPLLRTRADLKIGFTFVNGTEIVYYS